MRVSISQTDDGLGIHIPPSRQPALVAFLLLWLCGWAAGEYFALNEFRSGVFSFSDLFLLIWLVPWTLAGAGVSWVIAWQLFGTERLFVTAGALVREWNVLAYAHRRVLHDKDILSLKVHGGTTNDLVGLGRITVRTTGKTMYLGSGLSAEEAELVQQLIAGALAGGNQFERDIG